MPLRVLASGPKPCGGNKYESMQDCKSRVSVFPVKRDAYSWPESISTREKLEKILRINLKISTLVILKSAL